MKVCVVGSGYVGLVTGACLAESGNNVVCVDRDPDKIQGLRDGVMPIYEPGLAELVERNAAAGRLTFTTDTAEGVRSSKLVFIAVGTPGRRDGGADMRAVDAVAADVAKAVQEETVLILKSTVPVGTNARIRRIIEDAPARIHVVSNPEFLKEGAAIADFMNPERIVIGCD
ncbi:MAG: nucleotide sugar dehydrogenase, partial [Myxococcota bacterium]